MSKAGRKITDWSTDGVKSRNRYRERHGKECAYGCGRPSNGWVLCTECRAKSRQAQNDRAARLIARGCCRECGWPASRGSRCLTCRTKRKLRRSRRADTRTQHQPPDTERSSGGRSRWPRAAE